MTADAALKRTGRPVHPLWAHFHRGEKRNRYHYHAYCSYCITQLGAGQVPPTRGVSSDMLRHLESCPSCPRKVVDTLKEICGQRERIAQAKKQAHLEEFGVPRLDEQVLLLETTVTAPTETMSVMTTETENIMDKRTESDVETTGADKKMTKRLSVTRLDGDATAGFITGPAKRSRTDSGNTSSEKEGPANKWKTEVLQALVVAGIPLSTLQKKEFQELLRALSPVPVKDVGTISSIGSRDFVVETAARMAANQLDRVKEGMSNSTIKSGLTLSVTCWRTLDMQELAAFTLINANGDVACVHVEDIGRHVQLQRSVQGNDNESSTALVLPLSNAIENVLLELSSKSIYVMGVVADSAVGVNAAKRVSRSARWHSLLVVPCIWTLLTSLAGGVLTHELFRDSVGKLVELASYFTNERLQTALSTMCGEDNASIPLPTKDHWFSFVVCLTKALHYSDVITAMCSSPGDGGPALAPLALRERVLENDGQLWKKLRELAELLAPLREAYSLLFQPNPGYEQEQFVTAVHGGITLAHVMYQLGRMSQQYAALAQSAELGVASCRSDSSDINVVAHSLHNVIDFMWQRYDLPVMVLAYVFDFHLDTGRLDVSNQALQWKAIASYFQHYFRRWICNPQENQSSSASSSVLEPISSTKVEEILNMYQLRQFPFDAETTSDYSDVSSFYSFVSESHPEICALCCRVYAISLAGADVRRLARGIGFVPHAAQTIDRPDNVELLLHLGFASSLKKMQCPTESLSGFRQLSDPEVLICGQDEWEAFADDWRLLLEQEIAVDEFEQLQVQNDRDKMVGPADTLHLTLDQLFFEALPPLPAAVVVAPSPDDPAGTVTQASVAL